MTYQSPPPAPQYAYVIPPTQPTNGLAVASLVLGIIATAIGVWSPLPIIGAVPAFIAFPLSVMAVAFGHIGLVRSRILGVGRGQAISGLVLGYIALGIILIITAIWLFTLSTSVWIPFWRYLW